MRKDIIYGQAIKKNINALDIVKDIFDLECSYMSGDQNNCWLFAAMGLNIQMHQLDAFKKCRST